MMENLKFYIEIFELDEQSPDYPEILSILYCISENYSDVQMSIDFVSDRVGKSRTQIYHYCDIGLGLTPSEIMHIFRIYKAINLMHNTNDNIKTIKNKCGYFTSKTLTYNMKKLFKENTNEICSKLRCAENGKENYKKYMEILKKHVNKKLKTGRFNRNF